MIMNCNALHCIARECCTWSELVRIWGRSSLGIVRPNTTKQFSFFRWYEYYTSSGCGCEGNHDTLHHRYDIPHDSQRAYDMVSHRDYTHGCFDFQTIRMILDLVQ